MKRKSLLIIALSISLLAAGYGIVQAHGGYSSWWGHMGGYGPMMGYGYDYERPSYCWSEAPAPLSETITAEEAQGIISLNLRRTNDRLKVGKVTETEDGFEVQVVTKKGEALVDRLLVQRETGRIYRLEE